jgi:hypothetical protein
LCWEYHRQAHQRAAGSGVQASDQEASLGLQPVADDAGALFAVGTASSKSRIEIAPEGTPEASACRLIFPGSSIGTICDTRFV